MITHTQMYFITMLDKINESISTLYDFTLFFFVLSIVISIVTYAFSKCEPDKKFKENLITMCKGSRKFLFCILPFVIISSILHTFIPSTKQMCAILIVPKIVNNEKIQECAGEIIENANLWMKELKPKTKK